MAPLTVEVRGYIFSERVPGGSEICYPAIPEYEHAKLFKFVYSFHWRTTCQLMNDKPIWCIFQLVTHTAKILQWAQPV